MSCLYRVNKQLPETENHFLLTFIVMIVIFFIFTHKQIKKIMKKILFLLPALMLFWACNNQSDDENSSDIDSLENDIDSVSTEVELVYQVPSPDDFFSLVDPKKYPFKSGLIIDEKKEPVNQQAKELRLGIIVADMAYLSTFDQLTTSVKYFTRVKELSDQLGLTSVIPVQTMQKIEQNMAEKDSLKSISENSFFNIVQALEESGNGKTLAVISAGGWIETMYVSVNLVKKFSADDQLVQRIMSQKKIYENVLNNMVRFNESQEVSDLITKFETIGAVYDKVEKEIIAENDNKTDSSSTVIGNKSKWIIDENTFKEFKVQVETLRKEFVEQY